MLSQAEEDKQRQKKDDQNWREMRRLSAAKQERPVISEVRNRKRAGWDTVSPGSNRMSML